MTREPVSVLLPTVEWGAACEQLAADLRPGDELLVCCDGEDDPVAGHDPPDGVEIIVAGEPTDCSGKANALAAGMERAVNDRFVWTDDDFEHGPGWLDELVTAGADGPASAVPVFVGGGWWRPFEPWYGALFALFMYHRVGAVADTAWGGGVTFTREELSGSVGSLAEELRTVLSDDYLLTQRLGAVGVRPVRSMVTPVEVAGDPRSVYHRLVRFTRIVGVNEGFGLVVSTCLALFGVAACYPLLAVAVVPLLFAGVYRHLGVDGRGFLFALPGLVLLPLATLVAMVTTEFEWAGRRYRFADDGTVTVLD